VVEVDPEEDTFVLETGSEARGKCYMKFVRQAILESDAVVDKDAPADKEEGKTEETTSETATEEAKTEEKPAEDKTADKE
ncbi:MAG: hypothetical protein K2J61_00540, partial [Clostridia bacterium]|nr:hypothetical protein [Clostridia bacterium]